MKKYLVWLGLALALAGVCAPVAAQTTDTGEWYRWFSLTNAIRQQTRAIQNLQTPIYYPAWTPYAWLYQSDLNFELEKLRHAGMILELDLTLQRDAARRDLERQTENALSEIRSERNRLEEESRHDLESLTEKTLAKLRSEQWYLEQGRRHARMMDGLTKPLRIIESSGVDLSCVDPAADARMQRLLLELETAYPSKFLKPSAKKEGPGELFPWIPENPESPVVNYKLALAYAKNGRYDEALGLILKVARLITDPEKKEALKAYLKRIMED